MSPAGYDRAIVDPTPGTTRDIVSGRTALGGWPSSGQDTAACAGRRRRGGPGRRTGPPQQRQAISSSSSSTAPSPSQTSISRLERSFNRHLVVANKADLPAAWQPEPGSAVTLSAASGDGIEGTHPNERPATIGTRPSSSRCGRSVPAVARRILEEPATSWLMSPTSPSDRSRSFSRLCPGFRVLVVRSTPPRRRVQIVVHIAALRRARKERDFDRQGRW